MLGQSTTDFKRVFEEELTDVVARREAVDLEIASDGDEGSPQEGVRSDLVGLSLSGGGVRSASFGLGVLQSLYRNGILKHVDYLSSVSGGGYVGALFSTLVSRTDDIHWDRQRDNHEGKNRLPFETEETGRQPDLVRRLLKHGSTLRQPIRFLSRHLWGLLLINLFALSGLVALASVAAYIFRSTYSPGPMRFLAELGFGTDVSRAFFPAAIMFVLWISSTLVVAVLRMLDKNPPRWPQLFYIGLIAAFVMGIVALFATGDIGMEKYERVFGLPEHVSERIRNIVSWVSALALSFFGAALIPYLNIRALLQSGSQSQSVVKSWVFGIASNALIFGTPFVVFYILAHENLSGHLQQRDDAYRMSRVSIRNWAAFWQSVEGRNNDVSAVLTAAAKADDKWPELLKNSRDSATGTPTVPATSEPEGEDESQAILQDIVLLYDRIHQSDRETWLHERWFNFVTYLIDDDSSDFREGLVRREQCDDYRDIVIKRLNDHCLADPSFYSRFTRTREESAPRDEDGQSQVAADFNRLVETLGQMPATFVRENKQIYQRDRWLNAGKALAATYQHTLKLKPDDYAKLTLKGKELVDRLETARQQEGEAKEIVRQSPAHKLNSARENLTKARQEVGRLESLAKRILENNWNLMIDEYPGFIRKQDTVFAAIVNEKDQERRMSLAGYSLVVFVVVGLLLNLNATSLHGFYRDQLREVWVEEGKEMPLCELDTTSKGGPIHVFNGTVNLLANHSDPDVENMSLFWFTSSYCGSHRMGFRETSEFCQGDLTVADATAISGAAVTATIQTTLLFRLILVLTNFRLGRWLPTPGSDPGRIIWPSPLYLFWELLKSPEHRSHCFVSDGGHLENTGIGSLMARRCRVIIAVDGSFDPKSQFSDLANQIRNARWKYGVQVTSTIRGDHNTWKPLNLDRLAPDSDSGKSAAHYVVARIEYPPLAGIETQPVEERTGYMVILKPAFCGDEPTDLVKYREQRLEFPHDPTLDQFFEPDRFESYRQLGEHSTNDLVEMLIETLKQTPRARENWLARWTPTGEAAAIPTSPTTKKRGQFETPLKAAVVDRLAKQLESADESTREQIYGHFVEHGEDSNTRLRRKIVNLAMERHATENSAAVRSCIEKVITVVGAGISEATRFLKKLDHKSRPPNNPGPEWKEKRPQQGTKG